MFIYREVIIINQEKKKKKFTVYDMTPLPDYTFKNRPISPYGWDDCGFKYQEKLKNPPADGEYLFEPYEHSKYDKKDEGSEDQFIEIQRKITEDEPLTVGEEYSYKLAMKRARRQANYEIDENNGTIYVRIEEAFKASNRSFPTARDGTRFNCPTCNTEEVGIIDVKKVASYIGVEGYKQMKDIQLFSIPEVKTEVLRRMKEKDFDGYIDEQNGVSADETGHCPICESKIYSNGQHTKGSKRRTPGTQRFTKPKIVKGGLRSRPFKVIEKGQEDITKHMGSITLIQLEDMTKRNFTGYAHKKSDGRGLHEVSLHMNKWRLPVSIIIKDDLQRTLTGQIAKDGIVQKDIVNVKHGKPCDCGCKIKVQDTRRSEVVCPECGYVFSSVTAIVDDETRWRDFGIDVESLAIDEDTGEVDRLDYLMVV